ncbi:MAG: hypothetical protein R2712_25615 [Vicinamibacterales bacterium]
MTLVWTAAAGCRRAPDDASSPPAPVRATWDAPAGLTPGAGADLPFGLALSPDGRRLVFPAVRDGHVMLHLQDLASGQTSALPGHRRRCAAVLVTRRHPYRLCRGVQSPRVRRGFRGQRRNHAR